MVFLTEFLDKEIAECFDIFLSLAQRRNSDRDNIQTIKKVLSESTICNFRFQITVCGSNEADIQFNWLDTADTGDLFGLDGTKKFYLQILGISPISSNSNVPLLASSNSPGFPLTLAPEKAPFS